MKREDLILVLLWCISFGWWSGVTGECVHDATPTFINLPSRQGHTGIKLMGDGSIELRKSAEDMDIRWDSVTGQFRFPPGHTEFTLRYSQNDQLPISRDAFCQAYWNSPSVFPVRPDLAFSPSEDFFITWEWPASNINGTFNAFLTIIVLPESDFSVGALASILMYSDDTEDCGGTVNPAWCKKSNLRTWPLFAYVDSIAIFAGSWLGAEGPSVSIRSLDGQFACNDVKFIAPGRIFSCRMRRLQPVVVRKRTPVVKRDVTAITYGVRFLVEIQRNVGDSDAVIIQIDMAEPGGCSLNCIFPEAPNARCEICIDSGTRQFSDVDSIDVVKLVEELHTGLVDGQFRGDNLWWSTAKKYLDSDELRLLGIPRYEVINVQAKIRNAMFAPNPTRLRININQLSKAPSDLITTLNISLGANEGRWKDNGDGDKYLDLT